MTPNKPYLLRFLTYQKERFPFLGHGLLVSAFTFSAISYSRICRGAEGFIAWKDFGLGVFVTLTLFFMIRIFDEFKDNEDDAKYRKYLPVPRGLVTLNELKWTGVLTVILQISVIVLFQPQMLWLYAIAMGYLLLMKVEFFVPEWLKKRQLAYITSHMVIIPLIDLYASGLDWLLAGESPHQGLFFFFGVSFLNGIVLEFGRKIKTPEDEEEGVISYSGMYGARGGTQAWIAILFGTMVTAIAASYYSGYGAESVIVLGSSFVICSIPGWLFIRNHKRKTAKLIERASGVWTLAMYLTLGGGPMIANLW